MILQPWPLLVFPLLTDKKYVGKMIKNRSYITEYKPHYLIIYLGWIILLSSFTLQNLGGREGN